MSKLSTYDEALSENAKQGIKSAKSDWAKAKAKNDTVGMAKANAIANSIRKAYGGYTGGDDGSSFYPVKQQTNVPKPKYVSEYDDKINNVQKRIMSREEFTYDIDTDPMYQMYKKIYTEMGNNAYDRALSGNALKTGGIVNTDAATSAILAQNVYNTLLADKATELYDIAYNKYKDSLSDDYNILKMLQSAENSDYQQYKDSMNDYYNQRDFEYKKYKDEQQMYSDEINDAIDFAMQEKRDLAEQQRWQHEFDYQKQKDSDENQRWQTEFDYQKQKDSDENQRWQTEFDYQKQKDANENYRWQQEFNQKALNDSRNYNLKSIVNTNEMALNNAKFDLETQKWKEQSKIQRYNTLSQLIKSIYETDEIVDIEELKDMLDL